MYLTDTDGDEETIHPDIVLSDESSEHALVIDCKSESLSSDQLSRYQRLAGNEEQLVLQGIVTGIAAEDLTQETTLSSFTDLSDEALPGKIAVVHFNQDASSGLSIWNPERQAFSSERLREVFPINVDPDEPLPSSYYPFDVYEGDKEAMVSTVFSSVISLAMQEGQFTIEDILNRSHPYWDKLGRDKQRELRARVETTYRELREAGLDSYLDRIAGTNGEEWQTTSKTIQAIHGRTEYYVNEVLDNLPQKRLDHHAWSSESSGEGETETEG